MGARSPRIPYRLAIAGESRLLALETDQIDTCRELSKSASTRSFCRSIGDTVLKLLVLDRPAVLPAGVGMLLLVAI
jgi:hypothetical protein